MSGRKTKSISFDLTDEFEKKLLAHAENVEKGKFSKYIKRLIVSDMEGVRGQPISLVQVALEEDEDDSVDGFL